MTTEKIPAHPARCAGLFGSVPGFETEKMRTRHGFSRAKINAVPGLPCYFSPTREGYLKNNIIGKNPAHLAHPTFFAEIFVSTVVTAKLPDDVSIYNSTLFDHLAGFENCIKFTSPRFDTNTTVFLISKREATREKLKAKFNRASNLKAVFQKNDMRCFLP